MILDQLVHWRLEGTPDVFTETRDGEEWKVIHSGGAIHDAGFLQVVRFDKLVNEITLSACVSLFSPGGKLALRLGIDPHSGTDARSTHVIWGGWYAPVNEWVASQPGWIQHTLGNVQSFGVTVFLQSKCLYPVKANTSRWNTAQLQVEYASAEPDPDPPGPDQGIAGQIVALLDEVEQELTVIKGQLGQVGTWLAQWDQGQAWADEYNRSLIDE